MRRSLLLMLLSSRRFGPYFFTQALGALNDNAYKNALTVLIALYVTQWAGMAGDVLINLAAALFILPFLLFSSYAGQLAERYEKALTIRRLKLLEVAIMLIGGAGMIGHQMPLLLFALFLLGLQSALFSPIKYSLLPEVLRREHLLAANGLVETGTFVAILIGTGLGAALMGAGERAEVWVAVTGLGIAGAGYAMSRRIPAIPSLADPAPFAWNALRESWRMLALLPADRTVFAGVLGISWFWYYGATVMVQIPSFAINVVGLNPGGTAAMLTVFIIGISLGSLLCHRFTHNRIDLRWVLAGGAGLTLFGVSLYAATPDMPYTEPPPLGEFLLTPATWGLLGSMLLMGFSGGLYTVPLYAMLQARTDETRRARIMAANSILNALTMILSSLVAMVLLATGFGIPRLLLLTALLNAGVLVLLPRFLPWRSGDAGLAPQSAAPIVVRSDA